MKKWEVKFDWKAVQFKDVETNDSEVVESFIDENKMWKSLKPQKHTQWKIRWVKKKCKSEFLNL